MQLITNWNVQTAMSQGSRVADIVEVYNVHNYRKNNLVYVGTPKCGSRYYSTLLLENGWDRDDLWTIDWSKDYVFGFIRDPLVRYLKGLVQDIFESESDQFDNHIFKLISEFKKFNLPMTPHSVPITVLLNGYWNKINWIPIGPHSHDRFIDICKNHSIEIGKYDSENIDPHHSNGHKQTVYEKIKSAFGNGNELYHLFFEQDHILYEQTKKKFEQN